MSLENVSFLLFGAGLASILRNVWDYYLNSKYANSDKMGAMINWHYGFVLSWLVFSLGVSLYPGFRWYYGLILVPLAVLFTWIFWFVVHNLLKKLGLIEKESR